MIRKLPVTQISMIYHFDKLSTIIVSWSVSKILFKVLSTMVFMALYIIQINAERALLATAIAFCGISATNKQ